MLKPKPDWGYICFVGGIIAAIAFVALFVRMPSWVGHGRLAAFLYTVFVAVFAAAGARSGLWIYERTAAPPERLHLGAPIKAAAEREAQRRKAAEFAESVNHGRQAAELEDMRKRCAKYEIEIRVLREELARRATFGTKTSALLCD
jgi:hypothetical protein